MKAFIVLISVAVAVQALTDEQIAKIKSYHKDCLQQSGAAEEVVLKARRGEFVEDAKLKEHLLCFSKKTGFQNEAGEIVEDVIRTKLNAELNDLDKTNALIKKCVIKKATPQETAYETVKCFRTNAGPNANISGILGSA